MMQIDCEVMNTRLIHVKEDAIPMHLSAQMRSTPPAPEAGAAANISSDGSAAFDAGRGGGNDTSSTGGDNRSFEAFAEANKIYDVDNPAERMKRKKAGVALKPEKPLLYKRRSHAKTSAPSGGS